jgi:DNA integrity scanning protein DisA with diadenylate cyclase activity
MNGPRYPAARAFATRLEEHFARHAALPAGERSSSPLPDGGAIEALIDAAFWASLKREEGYSPEISLAWLPPERALQPLRFATPLPLGPRALARLAPAVERPGIHLGVWRGGDGLVVWGTTRAVPSSCFVLEVVAPGVLVVKHRIREDSPKFRNVAVFEGEQVKVLSWDRGEGSEHPALVQALLAPESWSTNDAVDVVLRLAVSMRAHKRGGTLLVVPSGTDSWRESIVLPIAYAVEPAFTELSVLASDAPEGEPAAVQAALARTVDAVAGLTAVDGATLITDRYELLAFGVKIGRPEGRPRVERLVLQEPTEEAVPSVVAPVELGGTRHISAAQFAQDQRDAVALVASQDGRFTVFAWSARDAMVHAHRVETLLL